MDLQNKYPPIKTRTRAREVEEKLVVFSPICLRICIFVVPLQAEIKLFKGTIYLLTLNNYKIKTPENNIGRLLYH